MLEAKERKLLVQAYGGSCLGVLHDGPTATSCQTNPPPKASEPLLARKGGNGPHVVAVLLQVANTLLSQCVSAPPLLPLSREKQP